MLNRDTNSRLRNIMIYVIFTLMMIAVIANKKNLHLDEILTYGLANYPSGWLTPIDGEVYYPSDSVFLEYVAVQDECKFNYAMVWNNQLGDTHPPMYYVLVHMISSLFSGKFSIWYAGILNIIFALLTLGTMRNLLYELTQSRNAVTLATILFMFSAGILLSVSFMRMYVMVMFEVTYITDIFVRYVKRIRIWRFYIGIILVSVIGALTHYYYIVFLFFLCLAFGVYLLVTKQNKDTLLLIVSMVVSGVLSIAVFPGMIRHMFLKEGYRGQESIENLKSVSIIEYGNRLKDFYSFINDQLFGGILTYIVITVFVFLFWKIVNGEVKGKRCRVHLCCNKSANIGWILVTFSSIGYFLLVSKMAVSTISRYLIPIYTVVIVIVSGLLHLTIHKIVSSGKRKYIISFLLTIMIVNSWKLCSWEYLYLDTGELLEKASMYNHENNIYIYDINWKIYPSFYELSKYNSVTFFHEDNIDAINNISCKNDDSIVVSIINSCDTDAVLNKILDVCPLLDNYEKIGNFGYATSYHLYSQDLEITQYHIYDYNHVKLLGCNHVVSVGENVCVMEQDSQIRGVFNKTTGFGTLWIDNLIFDIEKGNFSDGSNIRLWNSNGTKAQLWRVQKNIDETCTFFSQDEQYVLAYDNNGNVCLKLYKENDISQKWWVEEQGK